MAAPAIADLELDLEVFSGPFDLLLTLVLREEVDLLEVELADIVVSYLDFLEARRYRRAAVHLADRLADEEGHRFRAAPLPPALRRMSHDHAEAVYDPAQLGAAIGDLLRMPAPLKLDHLTTPRVSVAERLAHLRALLRAGACSFDEAVRGADRVTVAVTLFALLELYKQGEASWEQEVPFGDIAIRATGATARSGAVAT